MARKPKRPQVIRIDFETFGYGSYAVIGDRSAALKIIANLTEWPDAASSPDRSCRGETFIHRGHPPVVWLPRMPKTVGEIGTLSHEAGHVVAALMDHVGIHLDRNSDEVLCHALGYFVRSVLTRGCK